MPNTFAEVGKVTNHSGLWDAKFTWYSPSATCQICFYDLKRGLRIQIFRSTWLCPIIKAIATQVEFLEPSDYSTVINYTFIIHATNVFSCFCDIVAQFKLIRHKFPSLTTLHIHLCSFQITNGVKHCTSYQHTNYHNTTNNSRYLSGLELLQFHHIHASN